MAMSGAPSAVIVGTGRSGSGYIAKALTAAGVPCGHEAWFNPFNERTPGLAVDSSWCAIPTLDRFDGIVWHQTRHPLDVISSHARTWKQSGPYWPLKRRTFRAPTGNLIVDAMAVYVDANTTCERYAVRRWKLEDVDAALLVTLGADLHIPVTVAAATEAIRKTPRNVNQHSTGRRLTWDDLPAGSLLDDLLSISTRYGYG
jgi:hypothetical protein